MHNNVGTARRRPRNVIASCTLRCRTESQRPGAAGTTRRVHRSFRRRAELGYRAPARSISAGLACAAETVFAVKRIGKQPIIVIYHPCKRRRQSQRRVHRILASTILLIVSPFLRPTVCRWSHRRLILFSLSLSLSAETREPNRNTVYTTWPVTNS